MVDSGLGYPLVFVLFAVALAAGSIAALACSPLPAGLNVKSEN
jgi:hypothetical protein